MNDEIHNGEGEVSKPIAVALSLLGLFVACCVVAWALYSITDAAL